MEFLGLRGERALAEIAAFTAMPKSSLLRVIDTLIGEGYLERTGHGRYRVTMKLWRIGCGAVNHENIHDRVLPGLQALAKRSGETALYAVYEHGHSTYIEKVDGSQPIRAYAAVGNRSPAYATATGKALLAWQDETEIRHVLEHAEPWTENTILSPDSMLAHLAEVRSSGFAVNRGEWRSEVWGVASPVFGRHGVVEGAVSISGPAERVSVALPAIADVVRETAISLSTDLGTRGTVGLASDLGSTKAQRSVASADVRSAGIDSQTTGLTFGTG